MEHKSTNIFLSWSKRLAKEIAEQFKADLEFIFGSRVNVFLSSEDIKPGEKAFYEINRRLSITNYGIFFITDESRYSPWIYYEAGAIAKDEQKCRVMVLRINVDQSALAETPLQQYQNCGLNEDGYRRIFMGIYELCEEKDKEATVRERIMARWKNGKEYEKLLQKYGQSKEKQTDGINSINQQISTNLDEILLLLRDNKYDRIIHSQTEMLNLLHDIKRALECNTNRDNDIINIQRENSYMSRIIFKYSQLIDKIHDDIACGDIISAKSNVTILQEQIKTFLADLYDSAKV
ncbi:MAG: TIR domain-containing protein [Clostridiales bacterium]|nr:TIR domain-containing protein [Clostridiales bacterium]